MEEPESVTLSDRLQTQIAIKSSQSWLISKMRTVPLTSLATTSKAFPFGLSAALMNTSPSGETSPVDVAY